jgi:methyl-accepting chemotaxis protein
MQYQQAVTPLSVIMVIVSLVIMFFLMRYLFSKSVLYKIGVSTALVIILATFITGVQSKLGPIHNLWAFPIQIVMAVSAYLYISIVIKRPLVNIIDYIKETTRGNLNVNVGGEVFQKNDEIGDISRAMHELQQGLRYKAEFARKIGEGTFDDSFTKLSDDDELGEALLNMQSSLKAAREQDAMRKADDTRRNWITEGQAKFAEILRQNASDVSELSYKIISNMVTYMGINQGGIFILNDDDAGDKFLELTGCFAFDRRKFLQKRVDIGEGLVGTCFIEGETIYLRDIPQDYIKITSGLGDENPSELLIVPLRLNEEIFGVLELASFSNFEKHQIEFAEKIGEIIASSISGLRINNRTALLLEKSQQQAEEMRAQEEEMRQNMEELNATQEAMAEKERANVEKIKLLTRENAMIKQQLDEALLELNRLRDQ